MTKARPDSTVAVRSDGRAFINEIVITQSLQLRKNTFTIDGQPFPWHVANGITTTISDDQIPSITITLIANKVSIVHQVDLIEEEDVD